MSRQNDHHSLLPGALNLVAPTSGTETAACLWGLWHSDVSIRQVKFIGKLIALIAVSIGLLL